MNIFIRFNPPLSERAASFQRLATAGIFEGLGALAPEAAAIVDDALKAEAPARSGRFRSTIRHRQTVSRGSIVLTWSAEDPLATWIIKGTRPHVIEPRHAGGVLRFLAASGDVVFTRHVQHPGTKPNDFAGRAWAAARPEVVAVLRRLGRDVLTRLSRA